MIDVAVDIVKKHLEEYYPNEDFSLRNYAKEYIFYSDKNQNVKVIVGLVDNEVLFDMHNSVKKKKILEKQLRLIGCRKYSERWNYFGYDRNI